MVIELLIVAATKSEVSELIEVGEYYTSDNEYFVSKKYLNTGLFLCGVGMMEAAANLALLLTKFEVKNILHVGIAGSLTDGLSLLDLVLVAEESYGDLGYFNKDVYDLGFKDADQLPFENKILYASQPIKEQLNELTKVRSISVNSLLTSEEDARNRGQKYNAEIEHMEGIAIFYVALKKGIPVNSVRCISNVAGEPDKNNWKIKSACDRLSTYVLNLL